MATKSCSLRLISWNVNGLNKAVKMGKVLSRLKHLQAHITFLQETHLKTSDIHRIKKPWMNHLFHSKYSVRARGAAIIIHKDIDFDPTDTILDPNGRFVIVSGILQDLPVTLACIYAPSWDDAAFFDVFFRSLPNVDTHRVIIGGDFNLVQDVSLDRSSSRHTTMSKSATRVLQYATQLGLTDPWRATHPLDKTFSFFSGVHHTYSRIDFFLLDIKLISQVSSSAYHPIVISDHAPVAIDLCLPTVLPSWRQWKFCSYMLSDEDFKKFITSQIGLYFSLNEPAVVGIHSTWEAFKAFIRGHIISFTSHSRRTERLRLSEIEEELRRTDAAYAINGSPLLYNKRLQLQSEYELLTTRKIELQLRQSRLRHYEQGDKSGKLLAHQARRAWASRLITKIKVPSGDIVVDPTLINQTFGDHFSNLYTSESLTLDQADVAVFDTLPFPQVLQSLSEEMGSPISISEVHNAIRALQSGKSPGPDGFTTEFYKEFSSLLSPFLVRVYNESFIAGSLPPSMSLATISLILKKDKDPTLCGSYRPISLLNVDFKILAKILAARLQRVLPDLIAQDQTGFIQGRHSFFNTRRLLNILYAHPSDSPEVVLSLDAEKAFDRVEWNYLFHILRKFGFCPRFVSWISLLYSAPMASVLTNGTLSSPFPLHRGTRQGCPLSPLLFNLAIEPLAIWLRQHQLFEGIKRANSVHKLSLYADDLLLYISNPIHSLPSILEIFRQFGKVSGYKLNLQKSELFLVNTAALSLPLDSFPFKIAHRKFRYLGITFTRSFSDLLEENFVPLCASTAMSLERWTSLPLSLIGRVNLIKMNVLPKFLYLFQHIPILINKTFFTKLDKILIPFIWGNKPARLKISSLQRRKSEGGLALPNFRNYYWACNIQKLLYWTTGTPSHTSPSWINLELSSSQYSLHSLICSQLPISLKGLPANPIVRDTFRIWLQFRRHFGLHSGSVFTPIARNPHFQPACTDAAFQLWSEKGIMTINDLYIDGVFTSFQALMEKFKLPSSHLFRFFQVRNFVRHLFPHFPGRPPESMLDTLLAYDPAQRRMISTIYTIISSSDAGSANTLKLVWEQDLATSFSDEQWSLVLNRVYSSSICARHWLLQFKVVHKLHLTNARLARIFPGRSDACARCGHSPANHLHMFWSCSKLSAFWSDIFSTLSRALDITLDLDPRLAMFGVSFDPPIPAIKQRVVAFCTLLARRAILLRWKCSSPPTHNWWLREILSSVKLEKLRALRSGSLKKFNQTWLQVLRHIGEYSISPD